MRDHHGGRKASTILAQSWLSVPTPRSGGERRYVEAGAFAAGYNFGVNLAVDSGEQLVVHKTPLVSFVLNMTWAVTQILFVCAVAEGLAP